MEQWRAVFRDFDEDGNGEFDQHEIKEMLKAVGVNLHVCHRETHQTYLRLCAGRVESK